MDQEVNLAENRVNSVNEMRSAVRGASDISDQRVGAFDHSLSFPNHPGIIETLNANMDLLENILGRLHFLVGEIGEMVP